MPPIETILAVTLAGFALSATPGPSMLYVLSRSMGQSRYAGLASALGLSLGGVLLAVATALGLAAIFERYEWIVVTLRYAGSAYLIWLGGGDDFKRHEELEGYSKSSCGGESVVFLHCMAGGLGGAFESENRIVFCIVPSAICVRRRGGGQRTGTIVDPRDFSYR